MSFGFSFFQKRIKSRRCKGNEDESLLQRPGYGKIRFFQKRHHHADARKIKIGNEQRPFPKHEDLPGGPG